MAMRHELPTMSQARPSSSPSPSRFGAKRYMYALMAGVLVLVWISYWRGAAPPDKSIHHHDHPEPQSEQLSVPEEKAAVGSSSNHKQKPSEWGPLAEKEYGLDGYLSSPNAPSPSPSPLSSSGGSSVGSTPGSYSGTTGGSTRTGNNNNNAGSSSSGPPPAAADRPLAVIIESDVVPNLVPLMLHFATVLGPSWGMVLFTRQDRWVEPLSPAFQRALAAGHLEVRFLPAGTDLGSSAAVSRFLTSAWVWEQLQAARRVLLFQSDSVLCAKAEARVDDYFEYDLVGAPIAAVYGEGYNGGLSLRNPRLFLQVARETDFVASGQKFEDQFFYDELRKRGAHMPPEDVAKTFSVETVYYETPLGYHQPQRWQAQNMAAIEEWCPEVKMLIGRRAE